ncbi:hypothetical protein [Lacimicrobium alkaliphilum]|uniref:Uncharacterized protein n=1 Tax=Lacimicrobium alkaliphilum TaxID=1526571 RepID=A0A0U2QLV3_9ALTE|nr:hypothetical protein [Lacimicrobium alkaliphilum]ALS98363.1 hypothetical protein AT746_08910 [Lacimicrobium alkaliphilum]
MKSFIPRQQSQRVKIIALLGSTSSELEKAGGYLGRHLTECFGGVFISQGQGFWSEDGNKEQQHYSPDSVMQEQSLRIELLVMPERKNNALELLQRAVRDANRQYQLDCHYLHVEVIEATAAHMVVADT